MRCSSGRRDEEEQDGRVQVDDDGLEVVIFLVLGLWAFGWRMWIDTPTELDAATSTQGDFILR
jgi:hypothetical protein